MTAEEFWNKYINEDILEIFDITCDFFSKELPREFVENCDVGEVILETKGHNQTAKEFGRVLKFIGLLKDKQPKLYREYFQYLDSFLIDYYWFHGDVRNVEVAFSNFLNNPVHNFDKYIMNFKKLLFFQYIDLLDTAIIKNFDIVAQSEKLIAGAEYDLAICKFYLTLEDLWEQDNNVFDKGRFVGILKDYGFDISQKVLLSFEKGLFHPIQDKGSLENFFIQDRESCNLMILGYFLKYMRGKNFSFVLSGRIWDKMLSFWKENSSKENLKPDLYFRVHHDKFDKHLSDMSGSIFIDNKPEMAALLWGSVYIYDFLRSIELISQETFNDFLNASKRQKGIFIGQSIADLWNYDFVHSWAKPDCISDTEFKEEQKIFRKSISIKPGKFGELRKEISEELDRIGELSAYIIKGGKQYDKFEENEPDLMALAELLGSSGLPDKLQRIQKQVEAYAPARTGPNVGRNEPCPCGSGKKYKKCCLKI